ncbi:MAG: RNA-binding protein [Actinobacteria bacterium]|nr:RNA-binding protein [Actinomycetota bacterium]
MTNKLFVGGLSYNTSNDGLKDYFTQFGSVLSANVITDRDTGRSRGFGFVEMSTPEEAKTALEKTDAELDGRKIFIKEAHPKTENRSDNRNNRGQDFRNKKRW